MRSDIAKNNQAIQAGHAALEYGLKYGRSPDGHPSLIYLSIPDKVSLEQLREALQAEGILTAEFHEPYCSWGLTAIACLLPESQRSRFKDLKLWRN